jgi:hypothetical protein
LQIEKAASRRGLFCFLYAFLETYLVEITPFSMMFWTWMRLSGFMAYLACNLHKQLFGSLFEWGRDRVAAGW